MYKAILFALDGDWVTDYESEGKEEVREKLADGGSRWFFYPIEAIIRSKGSLSSILLPYQRILEIPEPLDFLTGKSIKTASEYIKENSEEIAHLLF